MKVERPASTFKYGFMYSMEPFKGYEEYTIVVPIEKSHDKEFGWCLIINKKGKRCPYFVKGLAPINADICSKPTEIKKEQLQKIFKK